MRTNPSRPSLCLLAILALVAPASAQRVGVAKEAKISATTGGFGGTLFQLDYFGGSVAVLGDLDGDGMRELAVGAPGTDTFGAIWILFLRPDLSVRAWQQISENQGGLQVSQVVTADFGTSLLWLGDRDGDGFDELAAGAPNRLNTVFVLELNPDGTVRSQLEIGPGQGGFGGTLGGSDDFGTSLASIGDLDGDGVDDLAVGAPTTPPTGTGAVWILFLNADGTVRSEQTLNGTLGGLSDPPQSDDSFGTALAFLGDLDGDGAPELAVGADQDDEGAFDDGSVWIVSLERDGTARRDVKISAVSGGLTGPLEGGDFFGSSLAFLGDADADGFPDLAVGAPLDDDGSSNRGAVYILGLASNGTVAVESKLSSTRGGFAGVLNGNDWFGAGLAWSGDVNADGFPELMVGATRDDDGPDGLIDRGALWLLGMAERGTAEVVDGIGLNPPCLSTTAAPALGASWTGAIDASVNPSALLTIVAGRDRFLPSGVVIGAGEVLVDLFVGGFVFDVVATSFGGTDYASIFVPDDLALLGFEVAVQAAVLGGGGGTLCNALRLVIGA